MIMLRSVRPESHTGLDWEPYPMDDGETWFHAKMPYIEGSLFPEGSFAVLTAEGNRLLRDPHVLPKLLVYMRAARARTPSPHVRKFLGGEGNGTVYALGKSKIAVKEAGTRQSIHHATERMDKLYRVIENAKKAGIIPRWIGMPKHYGYLIPPREANDQTQFLIMEQIDGGVTVEDVLKRRESDERDVRPGYSFSEADAKEIAAEWEQMEGFLRDAIAHHNETYGLIGSEAVRFKDLVPDFHAGNVLVDKRPRTVDGKKTKLWIIDQ